MGTERGESDISSQSVLYYLKFMKVGCGSAIYTEFEYSSLD